MKARTRNAEILKVAGLLAGGTGVIAAVYLLLVVPQDKKVQGFRKELANLEVKSQRYDKFLEYRDRITEQRPRIVAVLQSAGVENILTDKSDQKIFEALSRIGFETNVMLDKISHSQGQQQIWEIGGKAQYAEAVAFIAQLEHSFRIVRFKIANGGDGRLYVVTMTVQPIDVPAASSARSGKDLLDMYEEIEASLSKLGPVPCSAEKSRGESVEQPASVSPASAHAGSVRKEGVQTGKKPSVQCPPVRLEDIFSDSGTLFTMVDGKVYKENEMIGDCRIEKIREKSVDILWRSRIYTLRLGNQ